MWRAASGMQNTLSDVSKALHFRAVQQLTGVGVLLGGLGMLLGGQDDIRGTRSLLSPELHNACELHNNLMLMQSCSKENECLRPA